MVRIVLATLLTLVTAAAAAAAPAHAATVEMTEDGSRIVVTAAPDERSDLYVHVPFSPNEAVVAFDDIIATLVPGRGCRREGERTVWCATHRATPIELRLGDGDDRLTAGDYEGPLAVDAGPGNDQVLTGHGSDVISGGDGDDAIAAGLGYDRADGGGGQDRIVVWDVAFDTKYNPHPRPARDDAACGEGADEVITNNLDSIAIDCETVTYGGTNRPDALTGTARVERFDGRGGPDTLRGGGGADLLLGASGHDRISGGLGADRIDGGDDHDKLVGGRGRDRLYGGEGNDRLDGRDRERDTLKCGRGRRDIALADRRDRVSRDCEVVRRTRE
jgi:hypothetical protein